MPTNTIDDCSRINVCPDSGEGQLLVTTITKIRPGSEGDRRCAIECLSASYATLAGEPTVTSAYKSTYFLIPFFMKSFAIACTKSNANAPVASFASRSRPIRTIVAAAPMKHQAFVRLDEEYPEPHAESRMTSYPAVR